MPPPIRWVSFVDRGKRWDLMLSCEDDEPMLADHDGIAFPDSCHILIDAELDHDEEAEAVVHEFCHVAHGEGGDRDEEERVISRIAGPLVKILRQFGFRLPRKPPEAAALQRRARGG